MELLLVRKERTPNTTIGELSIDGKQECFILEDYDRGLSQAMPLSLIKRSKVYGKTAIPRGRYEVAITWSARFERLLPLLIDVPGYAGIRIHPGNTAADTLGCLLPGTSKGVDVVNNSRVAFKQLFNKMQAARHEKIFITIE